LVNNTPVVAATDWFGIRVPSLAWEKAKRSKWNETTLQYVSGIAMLNKQQAEAHGAYDSEQASPRAVEFDEEGEVFKKTASGVNFRQVGWFNAAVIFTKILFATGVLSLPSALYSLGAVGGSISIVAWGCFNTYCFVILGNFRMRHPHCHSIADMAQVAGGVVGREATGLLFIIAYVLVTGSDIVGVSTALNALSHHGACTVWWSFLAAVVIIATASIRKLEHVDLRRRAHSGDRGDHARPASRCTTGRPVRAGLRRH
jgi:hypothetical protein